MYELLCHSGVVAGSFGVLALVVASIGGLGAVAVAALRRATRKA